MEWKLLSLAVTFVTPPSFPSQEAPRGPKGRVGALGETRGRHKSVQLMIGVSPISSSIILNFCKKPLGCLHRRWRLLPQRLLCSVYSEIFESNEAILIVEYSNVTHPYSIKSSVYLFQYLFGRMISLYVFNYSM